jgi:hypothetical protein
MTTSPKAGAQPQAAAHLPPYQRIAEPLLLFGPGPEAPTDVHPLLGLLRHGPYARPPGLAAVRIATITVRGQQQRLFAFLKGLSAEHQPTDRKAYLPAYPGFETVFGLPLLPAEHAHVELLEGAAGTGTDGHERLAGRSAHAGLWVGLHV